MCEKGCVRQSGRTYNLEDALTQLTASSFAGRTPPARQHNQLPAGVGKNVITFACTFPARSDLKPHLTPPSADDPPPALGGD